jgi:hypothetical protein
MAGMTLCRKGGLMVARIKRCETSLIKSQA